MNVHLVLMYIMRVLHLSRKEVGEWVGVTENAVTKWIALSSGCDHSGYGHVPRKEHMDKIRELRREARCVDVFNVPLEEWRKLSDQTSNKRPNWQPAWRQFATYSCASAKHYPADDPEIALDDLGDALLADELSETTVRILSAPLSGTADARCYGSNQNWGVIVKQNLSEQEKSAEIIREIKGHVFHVKPSPDSLPVEQTLQGMKETNHYSAEDIAVNDSTSRRKPNQRSQTWVQKRSEDAAAEKRAIARFVAIHILRAGMLVQIASGTTENCLMDEIIANEIEDIQITTNNLQVLVKGLRALPLGTSVNLTGGTLNPSIDSLIGPDAARVIADDRYMPHAVFFGAAGLSFQNRLCISYAFEDEEATQVAYATRPTEVRVLMADDSKLGRTCGRRAPVSIEQMMQTAKECIVVSSYKVAEEDKIQAEADALRQLLQPLVDVPQYRSKNFLLRLVDLTGALHREYSLQGLREGNW